MNSKLPKSLSSKKQQQASTPEQSKSVNDVEKRLLRDTRGMELGTNASTYTDETWEYMMDDFTSEDSW